MNFYERVKHIVRERGMSLNQFYTMIGLNPDSIKNAKAIKAQPKLDVALKIAQTLDLSVEYLATGEDFKGAKDVPHWKDFSYKKKHMVEVISELHEDKESFNLLYGMILTIESSEKKANHAHG